MIAVAVGLTGCVMPETGTTTESAGGVETASAPAPAFQAPRGTSPAALAALPAGMSPAMLIRDGNGCYGLAIEATEPVSGIPLRGPGGAQVCDA
ncbi:hypothetical protein PARPLA_02410 [Rhodobacteraceae bacterium THAF1]|uniref:hypothetical protein n=1 Tax=Palleronia sp. THAF1 TaxID=2587842 RepID=UPI000F3DD1CC|nr:hypothetical protein [Palleronia sp. THAF1]QFU09220.1 hypothetical protein FIU81_11100 [Palleronia sp. THAF1]VDC27346.1 hypothetical protein PARPLA_02410 [Rhodobacteraceae bacterium THAF1]